MKPHFAYESKARSHLSVFISNIYNLSARNAQDGRKKKRKSKTKRETISGLPPQRFLREQLLSHRK